MAFPAATIGAGAIGAFGALFAGQAQSKMYQYQAGIANINSQVAKQDAIYAQQTGEVEAQQAGLRTAQQVGQTKAAYGAGNISVAGGSAAKVISSEIAVGQQNEAITRANAAKRAFGFEVEAAQDTAQASLDTASASTAVTSSYFSAGSSILGSVGQAAGQVSQGKMAGMPWYIG